MKVLNIKAIAVSIFMLCLAISFAGCKVEGKPSDEGAKKSKDLKVGYIDSDKLLSEYPEFKTFTDSKELKAREIRKIMSSQNVSDEDKKKVQTWTLEFAKKEAKILNDFVAKAREASSRVMEEKKYDLVLNNAQSNSVMEYGGEDITADVQVKMIELNKSKDASGGKKE